MKAMKVDQVDWKYVGIDPDPDFDPEHNKRVIKESIEKNQRLRARRNREYGSKLRERAGAVAQYLYDLDRGKTSSGVEKYFGSGELARLRGEEIGNIIRAKIGQYATKQKTRKEESLQ